MTVSDDVQKQAVYLRWLVRVSDDMWGAVQLLGLFFLGATILCVPPRYAPPSPPAIYPLASAAPLAPAPTFIAAAPVLVPASVQPLPPLAAQHGWQPVRATSAAWPAAVASAAAPTP